MENIKTEKIVLKIDKPEYKKLESLSIFFNEELMAKVAIRWDLDFHFYRIKNYTITWKNDMDYKYENLQNISDSKQYNFASHTAILDAIKKELQYNYKDIVLEYSMPLLYKVTSNREEVTIKEYPVQDIKKEKGTTRYFLDGNDQVTIDDNSSYSSESYFGSGFGDLWSSTETYFLKEIDATNMVLTETDRVNGKYKEIYSPNYILSELRDVLPNFEISEKEFQYPEKVKQYIFEKTVLKSKPKSFIDVRIIFDSNISNIVPNIFIVEIISDESLHSNLRYKGKFISTQFIREMISNHITNFKEFLKD